MLPVVIIAGGLATRLYPVTLEIPKSLIDINGQPFIHHQLLLLKEKGVTQVILCVGHLGERIKAYVGDGSQYGIDVRYSYDGDHLLGTGGAIKKASGLLPEAFMVQYGDSYLDIDFKAVKNRFFQESMPVLMTVYHNRNTLDASNILMRDGSIIKYKKNTRDPAMEYIDYGLIVISKKILDGFQVDEVFDLSILLSKYVSTRQVTAFEVYCRFYEIGSTQGIKETGDYIRNRIQN
jgi:N-acetyl-alpha-D-muramate 1-phosphate uridylyltransferase